MTRATAPPDCKATEPRTFPRGSFDPSLATVTALRTAQTGEKQVCGQGALDHIKNYCYLIHNNILITCYKSRNVKFISLVFHKIQARSGMTKAIQFAYISILLIFALGVTRIFMVPVSASPRMACSYIDSREEAVAAVNARLASGTTTITGIHDFLVSSGFYNRDIGVADGSYKMTYYADMSLRRPCFTQRLSMGTATSLVVEVGPDNKVILVK